MHSICNKFPVPSSSSIDKDDIIQSGYEGLWKACLSFDETKGYEFSTYAFPTIKGTILRMLRESELLHIPRVYKDIRSSLNKHGFTLPLSDMEMDVLLSEGKFSKKQLLDYSEPEILSLDAKLSRFSNNEDNDNSLSDIIPSSYTSNFDSCLSDDEIEEIIDNIILYIKPKYRDLVEEWMYASLEGIKLTQNILSKKYNLSQPQVNRVIKSAISIVRMHGKEIREMFGY